MNGRRLRAPDLRLCSEPASLEAPGDLDVMCELLAFGSLIDQDPDLDRSLQGIVLRAPCVQSWVQWLWYTGQNMPRTRIIIVDRGPGIGVYDTVVDQQVDDLIWSDLPRSSYLDLYRSGFFILGNETRCSGKQRQQTQHADDDVPFAG